METKKLSPEQLQKLQESQERFVHLIKVYGELCLNERLLARDKAAVEAEIDMVEFDRQEMVRKLQEEFGTTGVVNLMTGEFVPDTQ